MRTPGDDDPDRRVGPAGDAERRKIADMVVLSDCEQQSVSYATLVSGVVANGDTSVAYT